ncbi:hypothetical protein M3629_01975 [Paenibacillus polysaccharolyticus]|uniref:hypothetical protein n=1 Tax=Paenibacillus polysaccharolyticus TaxID=582692 RepID=UPI00203B3905|nr:hypothetical protein [Paenibacillus polysaccharolyticus]MCM3131533.1 hypothetical protein [Paenibacillus polysaccharolyticus]
MKQTLSNQDDVGYLFNVDILIKSRSNALALQSLIEFINKEEQIADFRIHSGIELGQIIEAMTQARKNSTDSNQNLIESPPLVKEQLTSSNSEQIVDSVLSKSQTQESVAKASASKIDKKKSTADTSHVADSNSFDAWIESLIKENRLTRIVVNNKHGKHQSIPCRILNFDRDNNVVSIYHVDEKQVYTFRTNEIDEFLL